MDERKTLTFHGNDEATLTLDHLRDHIVDETVLVPDTSRLKVLPVLRLVDLLEDVLESAIVLLQNRIFGAHVQRHLHAKRVFETCVREPRNALLSVVLRLSYTTLGLLREFEDLDLLGLAAFGCEDHLERTWPRHNHVFRPVLVTEGMPTDDNGLLPARH